MSDRAGDRPIDRGLGRLATLEDVLGWCRAHRADILDVIIQDEFTHDVVVREPRGFLVFDTT